LGSGTGVVGVAMALLGSSVLCTDQQDILEILERNLKENLPEEVEKGSVACCELSWGSNISSILEKGPFDFIVCSDVVYEPQLFSPLIKTLKELCTTQTEVFLAYKERYKREEAFFEELKQSFVIQKVPSSQLLEEYKEGKNIVFRLKLMVK